MTETPDTRTRILEAAARVFAQKGYHETRVDDIVAESGTSKGSVYFHFVSKEKIFLALIDTFANLLEERLHKALESETHGLQQMDVALRSILSIFQQYRGLAKVALVQAVGLGSIFEEHRRAINDRFAAVIQERIEKGIEDGSLPPQNAALVARAWVGALNEIVTHWIYAGSPDLNTVVPEIESFLLHSIGARGESNAP